MNQKEIFSLLKQNFLFKGLNNEQLSLIISISDIKKVLKNEYIIREGEKGNEIYMALAGKMEILKKDEQSGEEIQVAFLNPGEVIGEMAFIDHSPRSASVRALEESTLLVLPLLKLSPEKHQGAFHSIIQNICRTLTKKLRDTDEVTVRALKSKSESDAIRVEMGAFLFRILVLLSSWIFLQNVAEVLSHKTNSTLLSSLIIFSYLTVTIYHVKTSIYPAQYFGLHCNRWKQNLFEGCILTLPLLILITLFKWMLVKFVPTLHGQPVVIFSLVNPSSPLSPLTQIMLPFVYAVFVPMQEFMMRGVLQSSIKASLTGPNSTFWSIILSNIIFGVGHAYISPFFAVVAFILGLFWGWLFVHQKSSLFGPIISHIMIGIWGLGFLNFSNILRMF